MGLAANRPAGLMVPSDSWGRMSDETAGGAELFAGPGWRPHGATSMSITVPVPGTRDLRLDRLLLDANGTLSLDGMLLSGVAERIAVLRDRVDIYILTADTFGTLRQLCVALGGIDGRLVKTGKEKERFLMSSEPNHCAAIGNGANDGLLLAGAALGIAVMGPEGAAPATLAAADVVCTDVLSALDLLVHPQRLSATLRL